MQHFSQFPLISLPNFKEKNWFKLSDYLNKNLDLAKYFSDIVSNVSNKILFMRIRYAHTLQSSNLNYVVEKMLSHCSILFRPCNEFTTMRLFSTKLPHCELVRIIPELRLLWMRV